MSEIEGKTHVVNRTVNRILLWFGLVGVLAVLCLQIIIRHVSNIHRRNTSYVPEVLYLVYGCTFFFYIAANYAWPSCGACLFQAIGGALAYISSRAITFVFFLQRANVSQAIAPVLGSHWFKQIFPVSIFVIWVGFCIVTVVVTSDMRVECLRYADIPYCQNKILRKDGRTFAVSIAGALMEIAFATAMLYLFVKPFTSIDIPSKIRRDLKWNIYMSGINLGTTIVVLVGHTLVSDDFAYLWTADRVLNVVTCFLMIRSNRQWLEQWLDNDSKQPPFIETQRMYAQLNPRHNLRCARGHDVQVAQKSFLDRFDTSDFYSDGFTCSTCEKHFPYFEYTFHCFRCSRERFDVCAACGIARVRQQKAEHPNVVSHAQPLQKSLQADVIRALASISTDSESE